MDFLYVAPNEISTEFSLLVVGRDRHAVLRSLVDLPPFNHADSVCRLLADAYGRLVGVPRYLGHPKSEHLAYGCNPYAAVIGPVPVAVPSVQQRLLPLVVQSETDSWDIFPVGVFPERLEESQQLFVTDVRLDSGPFFATGVVIPRLSYGLIKPCHIMFSAAYDHPVLQAPSVCEIGSDESPESRRTRCVGPIVDRISNPVSYLALGKWNPFRFFEMIPYTVSYPLANPNPVIWGGLHLFPHTMRPHPDYLVCLVRHH